MNAKRSMLYRAEAVLLALALLLSACGTAAPTTEAAPLEVPPAEQTGSLTVLEWAGYDAEDFWVVNQK